MYLHTAGLNRKRTVLALQNRSRVEHSHESVLKKEISTAVQRM